MRTVRSSSCTDRATGATDTVARAITPNSAALGGHEIIKIGSSSEEEGGADEPAA